MINAVKTINTALSYVGIGIGAQVIYGFAEAFLPDTFPRRNLVLGTSSVLRALPAPLYMVAMGIGQLLTFIKTRGDQSVLEGFMDTWFGKAFEIIGRTAEEQEAATEIFANATRIFPSNNQTDARQVAEVASTLRNVTASTFSGKLGSYISKIVVSTIAYGAVGGAGRVQNTPQGTTSQSNTPLGTLFSLASGALTSFSFNFFSAESQSNLATELNAEVGDRFRNTYAEIKKDSVGYLKRNSNFVLLMRQLSPSVTRMIADVGILLDGMTPTSGWVFLRLCF